MVVKAEVDNARNVLLVKPPMADVVSTVKSWLSIAVVCVLLKPTLCVVVSAAACAVVNAIT